MLTSITIGNFKSFEEATLPLRPLTYLIGANGSGKSNALEALRLMTWLAGGMRPDEVERALDGGDAPVRGSAADLFRNGTDRLTLGCRLTDPDTDWSGLEMELALESGRLVLKGVSIRGSAEDPSLSRVELSSRAQTLSPGASGAMPQPVERFRERLLNIFFLSPDPAAMRRAAPAGDDESLKEDASNLSAVLARLCAHEETKRSLLDFTGFVPDPAVTDISFVETEDGRVSVRLHEVIGDGERTTDAASLSDGTLRALALGAFLLSVPGQALVVLENVDRDIYPGRFELLSRKMRAISEARGLRVLVTSHNTAFMDVVPPRYLRDVLCCYRDPHTGDSRIVGLTEREHSPGLIARGSLGRLMTFNYLERFLKDTRTNEERVQETLAWLREMEEAIEKSYS